MGFPKSGLFEGFIRKHTDGRRWRWRANKGVWQIKADVKDEADLVGDTGSTGPQGIQGPPGPAGEGGKVVFAGFSSSHGRVSGWSTPNLNSHHIAPDTTFVTQSSGSLTIVKAGYYKVSGHVLMHDNGGSSMRCRTLVNGSAKQYTYLKAANSGWNTAYPTHSQYYNVGQYISFSFHTTGGNPYNYHAHSYHSRIYLTYLGEG